LEVFMRTLLLVTNGRDGHDCDGDFCAGTTV